MFKKDLVIVDDLYPHMVSLENWRGIEIRAYMDAFEKVKVYTNCLSRQLVGNETVEEIFKNYSETKYKNYKVKFLKNFKIPKINAKLHYAIFLNNIFNIIDHLEKYHLPFVFELYPGGGFSFNEEESDAKLQRVLNSKYFRGVICNSIIIKKYLLDRNFCKEEDILCVKGIIMDSSVLNMKYNDKIRFGYKKERLDIAFVAFKYTDKGQDKGYDVVVEVARRLIKDNKNIYFHIVGNFDENTINVSDIKDNFIFYGIKDKLWFDTFYLDKDIFLSPNKSNILAKGAFDGFPTTAATDAMLRNTLVMCTDDFNQNDCMFDNLKDIIILKSTDIQEITDMIKNLSLSPNIIKNISISGCNRAKQIYSEDSQIKTRVNFLKTRMR